MNTNHLVLNSGGGSKLLAIDQIQEQVMTAVRGVRFGSVEITVHDGRVVQIERTEKIRFASGASKQEV